MSAHYSASKISWLLQYDETILNPTDQFIWLCIPDYLVFKLTGNLATENTVASRTLCLNVKTGNWSDEIKRIFEISNVSFPPIFRAGEKLGMVTGKVASLFDNECVVTIAGHDHMCGASGIELKDDELLDSTGTTEAIMALTISPDTTLEAQRMGITNGIYTDGKHNTRFSVIPSAGSTIAWFMKVFRIDESKLHKLLKRAQDAYDHHEIFESQVLVIPHFKGSGAPNKSSLSKGLIYGLTTETSLEELIFGLFLGLTCEYYIMYSTIFEKNKYHKIKVIGPATQDNLWLQLKADLFGMEVDNIAVDQAVSQGAYSVATGNYLQNDTVRYIPTDDNAKKSYLLDVMLKKYQKIYHNKVKCNF
ncbi:FGGY family carbohydrate kinase [Lactobacillus sp. ESL0677]|nr:FGGY family carbohydrate kinase [Lactobacillus sp. ESL0677]WEV37924.1 FGGY family carbohydrate kinase [Lactobacillus sp. ESL0677]